MSERWSRVAQLFEAAMGREPTEREAFIRATAAGDSDLRRQVESLLSADGKPVILDEPASAMHAVFADNPPVQPGTLIGSYRIDGLLGVGGMGEVYRARDTKLNRDVAIKILPPAFANDPDRLARFKREAHVLASLNHPNIATIHGFEDAGGVHALVMELVEGPTLADRLERGRLDVEEAVAVARQIADAFEVAHGQGIIHRDLKPANIKVRDDGTVKVLDFGLAKIAEAGEAGEAGRAGGLNTQSPTITTPAMTAAGMILGTAAYMSPEQAKGKPADKRSDIWAFGCVLYEMLSGKRAFDGEDVSDTLAAILRGEPDWSALPATLPAALRTLIQRSLVRNPSQRISDIAVAKFLLTDVSAVPDAPAAVAQPSHKRSPSRSTLFLTGALALLAGAALVSVVYSRLPRADQHAIVGRFSIPLPSGQVFPPGGRLIVGISRDGSQIAYTINSQLFLRSLSDLQPRAITGELKSAISQPVFSPDGKWVAFFTAADNTIKRVALAGGTPSTICTLPSTSLGPLGLSWEGDDLIFGLSRMGVMRVPASGGTPQRIIAVGEDESPDTPQLLPGGREMLLTLATGSDVDRWDKARIVMQTIGTDTRTTLIEDASSGHYLPSGQLVYGQGGTLFAVALDLPHRKTVGASTPVVEGVLRSVPTGSGIFHFAVSDTGSLVYVPGPTSSQAERALAVIDPAGSGVVLPLPAAFYFRPRVSHDSKQVALEVDDGQDANVSIFDLPPTNQPRRLTFGGHNRLPIWSFDDKRVAFQSDRDGNASIYVQRADGGGGGVVEPLTKAQPDEFHIPESWSPDGRTLLYTVRKKGTYSLFMLSLPDKTSHAFRDVHSAEPIDATFSPDGRQVVYSANQNPGGSSSSNRGVYIEPFPPTGEYHQIPKERLDFHPAWVSADKLVYVSTVGRFSSVSVQTTPTIAFGPPTNLPVNIRHGRVSYEMRDFDVLPRGRLLITTEATSQNPNGDTSGQLRLVLNWVEELKQRMPVK